MQPPLYANNADTPGFDDDGGSDSVSLAQDDPVSSSRMEISPQQFLQLLNEEAKKTLSQTELVQLTKFMEDPFVDKTSSLRPSAIQRLEAFYANEVQESKQPRDRLSAPSGREGARLGVIMHCQTKDGAIGEFWDTENRSIQALDAKGFNPSFLYGFDWHWRAESKGTQGKCRVGWSASLRALHDQMSVDLLQILPLPLVVIFGSCAKAQYLRTWPHTTTRRKVIVPLPWNIRAEFELDFGPEELKRITAFLPHPSAIFFLKFKFEKQAFLLDCTLSFLIWLSGKTYIENVFMELRVSAQVGSRPMGLLKEMYFYQDKEMQAQKILVNSDYDAGFLAWAEGYLEDSSGILARGESLVVKLGNKVKQSMRIS